MGQDGKNLHQLQSKRRLRSRVYTQLRRLNTKKSNDSISKSATEMDGLVPGVEVYLCADPVMDGLVPGAEVYLCADPVQGWVWKRVLCDVMHVLRKLRSSGLWILDFWVRNVCSVAHMPSPKTVPKRATLPSPHQSSCSTPALPVTVRWRSSHPEAFALSSQFLDTSS